MEKTTKQSIEIAGKRIDYTVDNAMIGFRKVTFEMTGRSEFLYYDPARESLRNRITDRITNLKWI